MLSDEVRKEKVLGIIHARRRAKLRSKLLVKLKKKIDSIY